MQLQQARVRLEQLDVQVLVVTFEGREEAREYIAETGLGWPLLVDADRSVYRAYGMHQAQWRHLWGWATMRAYWREARQGRLPLLPRADTAQQGGNVLVDPTGVVRLHHVGRGPADRPPVDELVAARLATHT